MKKIKINKEEIIKSIVLSLLVFVILIVGYSLKKDHKSIWATLLVTQLAFTTIWLIGKTGVFKIHGFNNIKNNFNKNRKENQKAWHKTKKDDETKKKKKEPTKFSEHNFSGVLLAYSIGVMEIIAYVIVAFT